MVLDYGNQDIDSMLQEVMTQTELHYAFFKDLGVLGVIGIGMEQFYGQMRNRSKKT